MLPGVRFALVYTCSLCISCLWGFSFSVWLLDRHAGLTPGGGLLGFSLVGSFPHCGAFCSSMCIVDAGVRFFLWVVYASLGLLALQGLGVMPVFFFLRPLLFRFPSRFRVFAVPVGEVPVGGCFPPVALSLLVSVSWVSMALGVLDLLILVFKFLEFWSFVPYTALLLLSLGPSLSVVGASLRPRLPGGALCALPGVCCFVGLFLFGSSGSRSPLWLGVRLIRVRFSPGIPLWLFAFLGLYVPCRLALRFFLWVRPHVPLESCFCRDCGIFVSACLPVTSGLCALPCDVPGIALFSVHSVLFALCGFGGASFI